MGFVGKGPYFEYDMISKKTLFRNIFMDVVGKGLVLEFANSKKNAG